MSTPLDARGLPAGYPFKESWEVTPRDARRLAEAGVALIVDVRTNEEVAVASSPTRCTSRCTSWSSEPTKSLRERRC